MEYPVNEEPYARLLSGFASDMKMGFLKKELGDNFRLYEEVKEITGISGIQARMPYLIEIH